MEIVAQQPETIKRKRWKPKMPRMRKGAFTRRRKLMILGGLFVLLVVTGYLNFSLNSSSGPVQGDYGRQQHVFAMFRQTRTAERASTLAILENIALSENYSAAARANAEQQKLDLLAAKGFENAAEAMILAQGFQDAVVSKNGENINVLIRSQENLTPVQVTQIRLILDSVANRTINIDNIFVSVIQ